MLHERQRKCRKSGEHDSGWQERVTQQVSRGENVYEGHHRNWPNDAHGGDDRGIGQERDVVDAGGEADE